jgi:hypothetical protein
VNEVVGDKMKKYTIVDCKEKAKEKGGECLSTEYINNKSKLRWKCKCGNEWEAAFVNILVHKYWCPICGGSSVLRLEDCNAYAKSKNGLCLSSEYTNIKQKIRWKCSEGHEWENKFDNIKNLNQWCPICAIDKRKETCINKYGVSCTLKAKEVKDKIKKTILLRYGVEHCSQNREIALKSARKVNKPSIKYHWLTNEELICQGSYEAKTIDYLNQNKINYKWQSETFTLSTGKTYRPDLYLTDTDTWVEIKGWMRPDGLLKWDEFQIIKPNSELWDKAKLKSLGIKLNK